MRVWDPTFNVMVVSLPVTPDAREGSMLAPQGLKTLRECLILWGAYYIFYYNYSKEPPK